MNYPIYQNSSDEKDRSSSKVSTGTFTLNLGDPVIVILLTISLPPCMNYRISHIKALLNRVIYRINPVVEKPLTELHRRLGVIPMKDVR